MTDWCFLLTIIVVCWWKVKNAWIGKVGLSVDSQVCLLLRSVIALHLTTFGMGNAALYQIICNLCTTSGPLKMHNGHAYCFIKVSTTSLLVLLIIRCAQFFLLVYFSEPQIICIPYPQNQVNGLLLISNIDRSWHIRVVLECDLLDIPEPEVCPGRIWSVLVTFQQLHPDQH